MLPGRGRRMDHHSALGFLKILCHDDRIIRFPDRVSRIDDFIVFARLQENGIRLGGPFRPGGDHGNAVHRGGIVQRRRKSRVNRLCRDPSECIRHIDHFRAGADDVAERVPIDFLGFLYGCCREIKIPFHTLLPLISKGERPPDHRL